MADSIADFDCRAIAVFKEQESLKLLEFVERVKTVTDLRRIIREYCLYLIENVHYQWNSRLKVIFIQLWQSLIEHKDVELLVTDNVLQHLFQMDPVAIVELVYDFRGFLFLTELEVDQVINKMSTLPIENNPEISINFECVKSIYK